MRDTGHQPTGLDLDSPRYVFCLYIDSDSLSSILAYDEAVTAGNEADTETTAEKAYVTIISSSEMHEDDLRPDEDLDYDNVDVDTLENEGHDSGWMRVWPGGILFFMWYRMKDYNDWASFYCTPPRIHSGA